jgi:hypothetical protein
LINSVVIVSSLFALNYLNGAAVRRFFDINIQQ